MKRFVLFGGPASGKTSVIEELVEKGFDVVGESARDIIKQHGVDHPKLQTLIYHRQLEYEAAAHQAGFQDRSLIDILAYSKFREETPPHGIEDAIGRADYHSVAFQLSIPPTEELFHKLAPDGIRVETYQDAMWLDRELEHEYKKRGFAVVRYPWFDSLEEKKQTILEDVKRYQLSRAA